MTVFFISIIQVGAAYSGAVAASYAKQHAYDSQRTFSNDCTNFVSCSLQAGGWREVGKYDAYYITSWYYDLPKRPFYSNTWTVADSMYKFMVTHPERASRKSVVGPYYGFKPGDVLQIDYERDAIYDHTMIVIAISTDFNDMQIAQHGDGESIRWFNGIKGQYSNAYFVGWSIK